MNTDNMVYQRQSRKLKIVGPRYALETGIFCFTNNLIRLSHNHLVSKPNQNKKNLNQFPFRNIEELTKEINNMNLEMEDMNLENEEMRERLGIETREELDVQNIKMKKAMKEEQAQALNRVLQKEVYCMIINYHSEIILKNHYFETTLRFNEDAIHFRWKRLKKKG